MQSGNEYKVSCEAKGLPGKVVSMFSLELVTVEAKNISASFEGEEGFVVAPEETGYQVSCKA